MVSSFTLSRVSVTSMTNVPHSLFLFVQVDLFAKASRARCTNGCSRYGQEVVKTGCYAYLISSVIVFCLHGLCDVLWRNPHGWCVGQIDGRCLERKKLREHREDPLCVLPAV